MAQKPLTLAYQGQMLKQTSKPDFIYYDEIIVEIKAVSKVLDEHKAQGSNYLKATGFQLCLLVNFGHYPLIEIVRVVNIKDYKTS